MDKYNLLGAHVTSTMAYLDLKASLLTGRLGVSAAILIFIAAYSYGIVTYGLFFGIAAGWLPCGILAWITAIAVNEFSSIFARHIIVVQQGLSGAIRQLSRTI
jgi:hypothetical protein